MQKLKNIEEIVSQLKPLLRTYLEEHDTFFKNPLMTCPNREAHANGDSSPSAGFVPNTNETVWNCFSCGTSSDIFGAYHHLEGKEIQGGAWYMAVQELADRYKIPYELEPLSNEEQELANTQQFLQRLVELSHAHLMADKDSLAWDYIRSREWSELVPQFQFGYVENTPEFQNFFKEEFGKHPEIGKHIPMFPDQLYGRLLYPVKHKYGIILGLVTRAISQNAEIKYQKHFLKNLEKGGTLFNINKNFKTVYVVEGASSVFTMYRNGIQNCVALLGKIFTQQMYNSLIKNGIERIIFCFDGDDQGALGLRDALRFTQDKFDIKIMVKLMPKDKDPDDVIRDSGVQAFNDIPESSNFKHQLNLLKETNSDKQDYKVLKESLFDIITSCKDSLIQDKMIKLFVAEMDVSKTSFTEELQRFQNTKGIVSDVGITEILNEQTALIRSIETFEERALRSGKLKGLPIGFPILEEKIDGLSPGLILIAGKWNTGKSAFMQTMALNLLTNPTTYVLYFSIDDSVIGNTLPRMIANLSMVPINTVANPINRIDKNETLLDAERLLLKKQRGDAIEVMKTYSGRLGLKDSADGYDVNFIEKTVKVYKSIAGDRSLVIFVDFLNMVKWSRNVDRTEQETQLAGFFKNISGVYNVPVVCTVEATKGVATEMKEADIKGSSSLQFRSDLTILLSSDFEADQKSEMYFYDEKGIANPIVRAQVSKNKMSSFRKSLYFQFYRDCSRFVECDELAQQEFARKF